jgi:hypothetical protein
MQTLCEMIASRSKYVLGAKIATALLLSSFSPHLQAHTQSTAFLTLQLKGTSLTGEWHLALRDLQDAVGLDSNDDGRITWGELREQKAAVFAYALSRLHLTDMSGAGKMELSDLLVEQHADGGYAVLRLKADGPGFTSAVRVDYRAFFDLNAKHRGLLRLEQAGSTQLAVFGPETSVQIFDLLHTGGKPPTLLSFINEGVWHIWQGYDHILFLIALLLPGVMRRGEGQWKPDLGGVAALSRVLKIVTAFTVAHSITLSLAAFGLVHLPTRVVESAIAGSVVVAALNNLAPIFPERGWLAAFAFGLLHGFGFANALRDLGVQSGQLALTLFGFNAGVEAGQLAIVAVFFPLALSVRHLMFYPKVVLRLGSVSIVVVAALWMAERALNFKVLPF